MSLVLPVPPAACLACLKPCVTQQESQNPSHLFSPLSLLAQAFDREQLVLYGQNFLQAKQTAHLLPQAAPMPLASPGVTGQAAAAHGMEGAMPMAGDGASEGALLASSMEGVEAEVGASLAGMLPTPGR